jgi:hypothetical protein
VTLEGGEHDAAFLWLVAMVEEIAGHGASLTRRGRADIGEAP